MSLYHLIAELPHTVTTWIILPRLRRRVSTPTFWRALIAAIRPVTPPQLSFTPPHLIGCYPVGCRHLLNQGGMTVWWYDFGSSPRAVADRVIVSTARMRSMCKAYLSGGSARCTRTESNAKDCWQRTQRPSHRPRRRGVSLSRLPRREQAGAQHRAGHGATGWLTAAESMALRSARVAIGLGLVWTRTNAHRSRTDRPESQSDPKVAI
jgi:hypothetical protein